MTQDKRIQTLFIKKKNGHTAILSLKSRGDSVKSDQEFLAFAARWVKTDGNSEWSLIAWSHEAVKYYGGTRSYTEVLKESMSAGRTIDFISGRYVPNNPDEAKEEAKKDVKMVIHAFRVGGIYRTVDGRLVKLDSLHKPGVALGTYLTGRGQGEQCGGRCLVTGKYVHDKNPYPGDLALGEVDEKGNPLDPIARTAKTDPDKQKLPKAKTARKKVVEDWAKKVQETIPASHADNKAMIERDLTAKLSSKPWVKKIEEPKKPSTGKQIKPALGVLTLSPDLRNVSHLASPVHGSAYLVH